MKRLLGMALMLAVSSVQAQELSFGDLNYFFKRGELNLLAKSDYVRETRTGSDDERTQTMGFRNTARATYGYQDNLNFFVELGFDLNMNTRTITDPEVNALNAPRYSQDGLRNPVLGADYRLHNQGEHGMNVDLGALLRVRLQQAELGSATPSRLDGNAAEPRTALEANLRIGRKWNEANEWRVHAGMRLNLSGEQTRLQDDTRMSQDAAFDLMLAGYYQYRPVHEFMMTMGLEGTRFGETDGDFGTPVAYTREAQINLDGRFMAKYLVLENLIVRFDYSQGIHRPAYEFDVATGDFSVRKRRYHTYGLGLDYLF
jgi:hypothetical protein